MQIGRTFQREKLLNLSLLFFQIFQRLIFIHFARFSFVLFWWRFFFLSSSLAHAMSVSLLHIYQPSQSVFCYFNLIFIFMHHTMKCGAFVCAFWEKREKHLRALHTDTHTHIYARRIFHLDICLTEYVLSLVMHFISRAFMHFLHVRIFPVFFMMWIFICMFVFLCSVHCAFVGVIHISLFARNICVFFFSHSLSFLDSIL